MCDGCWEEAGKPKIKNEKVSLAAKLAESVYEFNCVGGNLHILLDDWNIGDIHVNMCEDSIIKNIHGHSEWQLQIERDCLAAFKSLTEEERASALAQQSGFDT